MQSISQIRALLDERGLRPKRSLGQNFLHDQNQLRKLIDAAQVRSGDLVLEVGPGTGTLTEALLDTGAQVIACEMDDGLASLLDDRLGDRITLIHADALEPGRALNRRLCRAIEEAQQPRFKLVANLPYQIASPLMATLLIEHDDCTGQFVTIQKEVADRLHAPPGTKTFGPLGIIVQALAHVERINVVPPTCFWPQPSVTSAMIAIHPSLSGRGAGGERLPATTDARRSFARFVHDIFAARRKQLGTILGREVELPEGIAPEVRPEMLTVAQLIDLWKHLND